MKRVTRTRPPGQWQFEAHTARGRGTAPRARQARTRNRKILTGSSLHLCSRVPHGPRKISRYVGMCSAIFAFSVLRRDVASHVASSGRACRVGRRVGRRVRWIDGSRSLSPFYFPARRAGGGRGRGARGGAARRLAEARARARARWPVRRVVSLSRLQFCESICNFLAVGALGCSTNNTGECARGWCVLQRNLSLREKIRVPGCTAPHLLGDGKWASAARTVTHLRHAGLSRDVGRGKLTLVAYDFATGRRALELEPLARLPLGGVLAGQLSVPLGAGAAVVSEVTAASNERPRRVRVVDERGDELAQPVVVRSRPWRAVCTQNPAVFTLCQFMHLTKSSKENGNVMCLRTCPPGRPSAGRSGPASPCQGPWEAPLQTE